jgi:hypothetical protein
MAAQSGGSNLPVAGIIALILAAIASALFTRVPLEVPRPPPTAGVRYQEPALQDLEARLWEDSFAAVSRELKDVSGASARQDERHTLPQICDRLRKVEVGGKLTADSKREARLLVLGVMVSNALYSDGEQAPADSLRSAGRSERSSIHPERWHVGYFRFGSETESLLVPFELYNARTRGMRNDYRAMVVWLEDSGSSRIWAAARCLWRVESLAGLTEQCGKQAPAASLTERPLAVSIGMWGRPARTRCRATEAAEERSSGRRGSWRWSSGKGCGSLRNAILLFHFATATGRAARPVRPEGATGDGSTGSAGGLQPARPVQGPGDPLSAHDDYRHRSGADSGCEELPIKRSVWPGTKHGR